MGESCVVCAAPAKHCCSACQSVFYCGREHQRAHWKTHKLQCCPYKVMVNQRVGRHLIAARDIHPGEVIISEASLVVGPDQGTLPVCLGCYRKVTATYFCSRCQWPVCGELCEKKPAHAGECDIFSKFNIKPALMLTSEINPAYDCITPLRCLLLKRESPKKWEVLLKFMSHNEERKQMRPKTWEKNQVNTVEFLRLKCQMDDFEEDEIHNVIGILDVNSFDIRGNGFSIRGMFPTACLMSHNCVPNTQFSNTDDLDIRVTATVPIKKGEEITDAYTTALNGTMPRRELLREGWFFDCVCERCLDPTEFGTYISALKCQNCDGGYMLSTDPVDDTAIWKCGSCEGTMEGLSVKNMTDGIRCEIDRCNFNLKESNELMKTCETILHPHHYHMIQLKRHLVQLYGHLEGHNLEQLARPILETKIRYCKDILSVLNLVEPGRQKRRGMILYELHGPLYLLASQKFESGEIDKEEFLCEIRAAKQHLQEAILLLKDERESSLEGCVGRGMQKSLAELDDLLLLVHHL